MAACSAWLCAYAIGSATAALASSDRPVEYWTIEPNEGQSAGGHSAIRIGEAIYHLEHRPDGLIADRRSARRDFERAYRQLGNRAIIVRKLDLPLSVENELETILRTRYFDRKVRIDRLDHLKEDLHWLERSIEIGRLEIEVPGLGLFADQPNACSSDAARARDDRRRLIESTYGVGWLADQIRANRLALQRTVRAATRALTRAEPESTESTERADWHGQAAVGRVRAIAAAAQKVAAFQTIHGCRAPHDENILAIFARFPNGQTGETDAQTPSIGAWLAIQPALEANFIRVIGSDRRDSGLAILLAWGRLVALDETRRLGIPMLFDSIGDGRMLRSGRESNMPANWRLAREANSHRILSRRVQRLLTREGDDLESLLFDVEIQRHALAHAIAGVRHQSLGLEPQIQMTQAVRHPALIIQLAWPAGVTMRDLKAQRSQLRALVRRERKQLQDELGYSLFGRNCVTELWTAVDKAMASEPSTAAIAIARHRDPESLISFIPVVADRIASRQLPVFATDRLASGRELILEMGDSRGGGRWLGRLRESNTLSTRTYRRNPNDSTFLFFSTRPIWLRPIAGIANLATGLAATAIGLVRAPFDRGESALRGLRGATMSIPELFFFNIRKGSYEVEWPIGPDGLPIGAFDAEGT